MSEFCRHHWYATKDGPKCQKCEILQRDIHKRYKPRNDYVLILRTEIGQTPSGIGVPDTSIEGVEHSIAAKGSDVEGLEIGDKVLVIGKLHEDYGFLPNSKDLFITKQQNVVMVYIS